jgi:hypothetical protein
MTLAQVNNPSRQLRHEPGACSGCGADVSGAPQVGARRRQVFDLPATSVQVTEHQMIARRCGCGATSWGAAPQGVTAPVQYGPRIGAMVVYLYAGQFLSAKRTAQAIGELFAIPVSQATVTAMAARAAGRLGGFCQRVGDRIAAAPVAGFDETGLRVAGKLAWVHVARTDHDTLITCHPKRGREGTDDAGVLHRFRGVAVHDAWAPYDTYPDAGHQLCCAHALRELQAVTDTAPGGSWCWATQAADALVALQKLVSQTLTEAHESLDTDALAAHVHLLRSAVHAGLAATQQRSTPLMRKHHALARRLHHHELDYLRFTRDQRVPADNNSTERDIRMIKLRQKVSGCLRTLAGARQFCAIRSYISTATKHGQKPFDVLAALAEGHPWLPETA